MNYVIGDVHGCFTELNILLNKIEGRDQDAIFHFVGDWIDRGPNVPETMEWVAKNITLDGKYRSVKGNHDVEAVEWFNNEYIPWLENEKSKGAHIPETYYDFYKQVNEHFHNDLSKIRPYIETVTERMPYSEVVDVVSAGGVPVRYRICHAWHMSDHALKVQGHDEHYVNLYYRQCYWGYPEDDAILIHGHTPTIDEGYNLRNKSEDDPGLICYRLNSINVDGGCVFFPYFHRYPCMLCAICLETLEEFYSYTLEERAWQAAEIEMREGRKDYLRSFPNATEEELLKCWYLIKMESYQPAKKNLHKMYREILLDRLNLKK